MKKLKNMKKILFFSLGGLVVVAAIIIIAIALNNQGEKETYTITFRQSGQSDQVYVVEEGEDFTYIPNPVGKTGYTVTWNVTDFSNITSNMVVKTIETPNTYTITYDGNGGTVEVPTQEVVYDSAFTLAGATYEGHDFIGWTLTQAGGAVVLNGVWKQDENVTLVANWAAKEKYTITFRQDGETLKIVTLAEGTALSEADIPTPIGKTGYTVVWNEEQLAAALAATEGNFTVDAVETIKKYTVTLENDALTETKELTYGEEYNFGVPSKDGYAFVGWFLNGKKINTVGIWNYDVETTVTLTAQWMEDDGNNWTGNY